MKTAEEQKSILNDLKRFEQYGCNLHDPKWFRSVSDLLKSQLDARAELEQQNQMLREVADKLAESLRMARRKYRVANASVVNEIQTLPTPYDEALTAYEQETKGNP